MNKIILIALGVSVIVGCKSAPEKPMTAAPVKQSEVALAEVTTKVIALRLFQMLRFLSRWCVLRAPM